MGDTRVEKAIAAGYVPARYTAADLEENHDAVGFVVIIGATVLAVTVVLIRLFSRRYIIKRFGLGLDDAIALASMVVFIPFMALCLYLIELGVSRNFIFVQYIYDNAMYRHVQVVDSVAHLIYGTALLLCRVSGLAFYYRICALHKELRVAIGVIFCVLIAGYLTQTFLIVFHCRPVNLFWAPVTEADARKYTCITWLQIYSTISAISLTCDFLLFGLPVAMLRILEMPRKQKIQLAGILLPGIFVVGISVSRVVLVVVNDEETFDWAFLCLLIVEVCEISATLVALSIPGIKPFVDKCILRKNRRHSEYESEKVASFRHSIGSQRSGQSALKARAPMGVNDDGCDSLHGALVGVGQLTTPDTKDGIQVTVDVYVENEDDKTRAQ